jgi:hypothetical protein
MRLSNKRPCVGSRWSEEVVTRESQVSKSGGGRRRRQGGRQAAGRDRERAKVAGN